MTNSSATSLDTLREKWQRAWCKRRSISELSLCPAGELHRIANDLGLSESGLLSLNGAAASELMPRRLEQLGLDPTYVRVAQTATYRDLERVCANCRSWRRCARDLAKGDVQIGMRDYCLNVATIDALTADRPVPRSA